MTDTVEKLISERSISLDGAKRDGTAYLASLYGQVPILVSWNKNYKKWACQANGTISQPDSKWFMGPHGVVLQCPTKIKPIPVTRQLGFFKWAATGQIERSKPWMKNYKSKEGEEE